MDIQDFRILLRVADVQSLSQVGSEIGLTPGTISKRLQAMEDELGVRLFDRTTRSIRITDEGERFRGHAQRIVDEFESARATLGESVTQPKGRVKLSAPASLARSLVAPAICQFMQSYPEVEVQIDLTDRVVNLQEEGYDLAIRVGVLPDSTLKARRLGPDRQVLVASPGYLEEHGTPALPEHLASHACLVQGDSLQWCLVKNGREQPVRVSGRLRSDSGEMLLYAALEGQGLLRTSLGRVGEEIAHGALVRVLADWTIAEESAVWAVYPSGKHLLPKMRVLLDFLADWFREGGRAATDGAAQSDARGSVHVLDAAQAASARRARG